MSWTVGAPGSSASTGSCTAGSGSSRACTARAASHAASGVLAATSAIRSPTMRTRSVTRSGWSGKMTPIRFSPGTSAAVSTASTPETARAAKVSISRMRADASADTATAAWSIPGRAMSPV